LWLRASLPVLLLLLILVQTSVIGSQSGWLEADFSVLAQAPSYPGTETLILNNLTNTGPETLKVTQLTYRTYTTQRPYSWDYNVPGLPLNLSSGENRTLNVTAIIRGVSGGRISAIIWFQYWNSTSSQWTTPAESPLVIDKTLPLQQSSIEQAIRGFLNALPIIIAIWWAIAVVVLLVFFRYEQRNRGKLVKP
jgi:hypothetical protein